MRVFRNRGFALVWLAGLLSQIGDWVVIVALPFYVYQRTGSVVATGALFAAETLPPLFLGSAAGVLVDRWDRPGTMVAADLLRGALVGLLLAVPPDVQFWLVYPVAALESTVGLVFGPAQAALVPRLVGEEDLTAANAVAAQTGPVARLVAPALGGLLVAAFGLGGALVVDATSFFASAALIALVPRAAISLVVDAEPDEEEDEAVDGWRGGWHQWRAGLAVIGGSRMLVVLFATGAVANLTEGMVAPLFVPFIEDVLHGGASEIGLWFTTNAVGVIGGGALVATVARRVPAAHLLGVGCVGVGVFCLARNLAPAALAALAPNVPATAAMAFNPVIGALAAAVFASHPTLLQRAVPDAYRGRVFGALATTDAAAMLVGAALATALGDAVGPMPFFHALGVAYVVSGAAVLFALPVGVIRLATTDDDLA